MTSLNASAKEFTPTFTLPPPPRATIEVSQAPVESTHTVNKEGNRGSSGGKGGSTGRSSKGRTPASSQKGGAHRSGDKGQQGDQDPNADKPKKESSGKSRSQQNQHPTSKDKVVQSRNGRDHDPQVSAPASEFAQMSISEAKEGIDGRGSGSKKKSASKKEKSGSHNQPPPTSNRSKPPSTSNATSDNKDHRGIGGSNSSGSGSGRRPSSNQKSNSASLTTNRRASVNPESGTSTAAGSKSGSGSAVIPGMEPTTFICLTDVIHPVRHVYKDGASVMEQGSDAYLDWIVRSLKEHEEITIIGMDAAIPDVIALVLRAGRIGIGYQEVRTFTTQDALGGNKSCLQFRMTRENGYIPLTKRPPHSSINWT
ncbi:hypothetical protein BGW41_002721 [Actinomortierella wolfii]|nr:hypothetical protein BGW41_002721 [Actinomortierella wolfii]